MYESYIEAIESPIEMSRNIVWTSIWLVECSPSLRSECMVFPYLKGLINKEALLSILSCYFLGIIALSYQIYNMLENIFISDL